MPRIRKIAIILVCSAGAACAAPAVGPASPTPTAPALPVAAEVLNAVETGVRLAKTEPALAADTVAAKTLPAPIQPELLERCDEARAIVIHKSERVLELHCGDAVAARFGTSLGFTPAGHKHHEGDGRTPEGEYYITNKFVSRFHRSLELGYPNKSDAERGLAEGQISRAQHDQISRAIDRCGRPPQNTPLGSLLQVHGGGGGEDVGDWTLGCVAVDNPEIEQVFAFHVPGCDADGRPKTPVRILP